MPAYNAQGAYVPNYDSCKSPTELENEFYNWAFDVCMGKFCQDRGLKYTKGETEKQYIAAQSEKDVKKNFYITTTDKGSYYWYHGGNKDILSSLKSQKHAMTSAKQKMRIQSSIEDISSTITTEIRGTYKLSADARADIQSVEQAIQAGTLTGEAKAAKIAEINQKYGTNIRTDATAKDIKKVRTETTGGWANNLTEQTKKVQEDAQKQWTGFWEGNYRQSEDSRTALQKIIDGKNNGTMTDQQANDAIYVWNQTYGKSQGIEIAGTASVKDLTKVMNNKTGAKYFTMKDLGREVDSISRDAWNNSNNEIVKQFTSKGMDADTMWGVITGKYNKDDAARRDLEKLAKDIKEGKLTEKQKAERVKAINEKYGLNLDSSVTGDQIAQVIAEHKEYSYKQTVRNIAGQIVENKLNDQLNNMLEQKFGSKLRSLGIDFSFKDRNIIQDIRDIIRGQKTVAFNEAKFLDGLKKNLEKKVDQLIVKKAEAYLNEQQQRINAKIDSTAAKITGQLDAYRKKIDSWSETLSKWDSESMKLTIAGRLDAMVSAPVDKIAGILNMPDKLLGKIGLNLGLGDMFKSITQTYTKGYAEKIQKVLSPAVNKILGFTKHISATITKLISKVNELKEKAKQMIEKWKNTVMDAVKKQTQKMINEIIKYVKLDITSAIGSSITI